MKFVFRDDNTNDMCDITLDTHIVICQGKFMPRKGRIQKIDDFIININQIDFGEKLIIDVTDLIMVDSTGLMKLKKIFKAIIRNVKEIELRVNKDSRLHTISIYTMLKSIPEDGDKRVIKML